MSMRTRLTLKAWNILRVSVEITLLVTAPSVRLALNMIQLRGVAR